MSRSSVRHAVATFVANANIAGIGTVFASPPKISKGQDAYANVPAGTASGSVIYVEVKDIRERRLASGGPTAGTKENRYAMRLHFLFRSHQPLAETAMDDMDTMLELIFERLRTDRTLGTNGAILQSAQDGNGLVATTGLPKMAGAGETWTWTLIDFDVVEVIVA